MIVAWKSEASPWFIVVRVTRGHIDVFMDQVEHAPLNLSIDRRKVERSSVGFSLNR